MTVDSSMRAIQGIGDFTARKASADKSGDAHFFFCELVQITTWLQQLFGLVELEIFEGILDNIQKPLRINRFG